MNLLSPFLRAAQAVVWSTGGGVLLLTAATVARADNPPVVNGSGKEYVLTHKSSFEPLPATARSPFWPIGWTPSAAAPTQVAVVQQFDVKPESFVVSTISVDAPALAIINRRSYAVGERVPVPNGGSDFVTVKQILDGVVVLDSHGHELRVAPSTSVGKR